MPNALDTGSQDGKLVPSSPIPADAPPNAAVDTPVDEIAVKAHPATPTQPQVVDSGGPLSSSDFPDDVQVAIAQKKSPTVLAPLREPADHPRVQSSSAIPPIAWKNE
jgi:hypothetical protein